MTESPPLQATPAAYGQLWLDRAICRPLDEVVVTIVGRTCGPDGQPVAPDERCTIRVCGPDQRPYFEIQVELTGSPTDEDAEYGVRRLDAAMARSGAAAKAASSRRTPKGQCRFRAGGALGAHYVYLYWPGQQRHARYANFVLDCRTTIESGEPGLDGLYARTREAMLRGRRRYQTPRGPFVGYISGDTWHFDGIWLRDWIYQLPAARHWDGELACGIDRFLEAQAGDGQVPDGIERDGRNWRVGLESDVEYIMVLGVWQTWQATGDDAWLARVIGCLEKALRYIRRDERHWDRRHRLVKRQHSCDTWDFDIDGAGDSGQRRHVIATCDASGYYAAFVVMAAMWEHLACSTPVRAVSITAVPAVDGEAPARSPHGRDIHGQDARDTHGQDARDTHGRDARDTANATRRAEYWRRQADGYRRRAVKLLWDGAKFLHHAHLDAIDHADFDEPQQLAMGNTWAMTRGLADGGKARSIIDEYRRRHRATGDAEPWWSLQPGYPDRLGYWRESFRRQGGYANGGLMPWVGGELCRACFRFGREAYGLELLRRWIDHLDRTGGCHVWYWPDGTPGFRTTNEAPYTGWGMAQWLSALVEGLAGIEDESGQMRRVNLRPGWACGAGGTGFQPVRGIYAAARYAASEAYFAYRLDLGAVVSSSAATSTPLIRLTFTGSGERADLDLLLPAGFEPRQVSLDGHPVEFSVEAIDANRYLRCRLAVGGPAELLIM